MAKNHQLEPAEIEAIKRSLSLSSELRDRAVAHIEVLFHQWIKDGCSGRVRVELIWKQGEIVKVNTSSEESIERSP